MSNNYKKVIYVGIKVNQADFLKSMGFNVYDEWFNYKEKLKIVLNGHETNKCQFGCIYTDDNFICIGKIIDAHGEEEEDESHIDLIDEYEKVKFDVADKLRQCKINIGKIKIYSTILCY